MWALLKPFAIHVHTTINQLFIHSVIQHSTQCGAPTVCWEHARPEREVSSWVNRNGPCAPTFIEEWGNATCAQIERKGNKSVRACMLSHLSCVWLLVTPWTVARQAPLSMGFSRQEYWSGLPCPLPGDLPDTGIKPRSLMSPALAGGPLPPTPPGKPQISSQKQVNQFPELSMTLPRVASSIFSKRRCIWDIVLHRVLGSAHCFLQKFSVLSTICSILSKN